MIQAKMLALVITLTLLLLIACAPQAAPTATPAPQPSAPKAAAGPAPAPATPAKPAWQENWEKVVEAAQKEGVVSIMTTAGSETRFTLAQSVKQKFGLRLEALTASGTELSEKLLRERRAGIYSADVFMGAIGGIWILKPEGALDPLGSVLILPDAKDPKVWWKGKLPWLDRDQQWVLAPLGEPESTITINTNLVQPGEIKSYKDLLNPKWKGKITLRDPTVAGGGRNWVGGNVEMGVLSWDYMRELAKQEPAVIRDGRLQAEWLAHGKYAIGIATLGAAIEPLLRLGAPLGQIIPAEGTFLSTAGGALALMNRSPHPNAAKVFINWFLTKEGQTAVTRAIGSQSRRLDVPTDHLRPEALRQPGIEYFDVGTEEISFKLPVHSEKAKEVFGIQR